MDNHYFEAHLNDGTTLDFDRQCNVLKTIMPDMLIFQIVSARGGTLSTQETLAMIPYKSIKYVLRKDKTNE